MTTILFVHGTGVREPDFSKTYERIKQELTIRRPDLNVIPCYWGGPHGTQLNWKDASTPQYDTTRGIDYLSDEDYEIALWSLLYDDPLFELRFLSLKAIGPSDFVPGQKPFREKLDERVRNFVPSPELLKKLEMAGILTVFNEAKQAIYSSGPYHDALACAPEELDDCRPAIARALVAKAITLCCQREDDAPILTDAVLRDELVAIFIDAFGGSDRGVGDWGQRQIRQLVGVVASKSVTKRIQRQRRAIMDQIYPIVGDILLYQVRGETIRTFIREHIQQAVEPVVVLAHSLGGIASVDLLINDDLPKVKLLVTVGSQATFFYEINALQSLRNGEGLPSHFPKWLNIYDLHDFLSFIGAVLFPGKVEDVKVNSKQPFPQSHTAYWTNRAVWDAIIARLP